MTALALFEEETSVRRPGDDAPETEERSDSNRARCSLRLRRLRSTREQWWPRDSTRS